MSYRVSVEDCLENTDFAPFAENGIIKWNISFVIFLLSFFEQHKEIWL